MNAFTLTLLALLAGSAAVPCAALDTEGKDELSDPDMLAEVKNVEQANLENAMAKGMDGAAVGTEHIVILMLSARADLRAAARDMRGLPPMSSDPAAATEAAPQPPAAAIAEGFMETAVALDSRMAEFRKRAASLKLEPQKLDLEKAFTQRQGYRTKDRQGDLARNRGFITEAAKKFKRVVLERERRGLVESAEAYLADLRSAETRLKSLLAGLQGGAKDKAEFAAAAKRFEPRVAAVAKDAEDLKTERDLLETSLLLAQYDDAAFDQGR